MPVARMKGAKGKCDVLFSKIIRSIGACERCGSTDWLQTSHVISRRYSATRCDLRNAQCLCAKCHRHFTDWPMEFARWIDVSLGDETYQSLKRQSVSVTKVDWDAELERLKAIAAERGIK